MAERPLTAPAGNERADQLCTDAMQKALKESL